MRRRITALLILAVMLLTAVPALGAAPKGRVEDFTVETTESGFRVILPAEHAEEGFYKLFWMDNVTGEVQKDVFPVNTPSYEIEAETGADYSFALFYAKKRGALPSSWKGDRENEPKGPSVWKMLWIEAETVECRGITNHLSEANHVSIDETAAEFEALVEEYTGGLVDVQIARKRVEEPVSLSYVQSRGYSVTTEDINADHHARFQYDSIFVFGRMDGIYCTYNGVTFEPEDPMNDPGYAYICLVGDDLSNMGETRMSHVCIHEWLHQLGFYYSRFKLEIPNPDEPQMYGYDAGATLDLQLFREALTMKTRTEAGKYIGVPAEAWQYKPTNRPLKWDLSAMQDQTVPEDQRLPAKEPEAEATDDPERTERDPAVFGTLDEDGIRYENTVMGIGCTLDNWRWYTPEEYFATYTVQAIVDSEEEAANFPDGLLVIYAEDNEAPHFIRLEITYPTEEFLAQYDETAFLEHTKELLEQYAPVTTAMQDFSFEIIQRRVGNRAMSGIKDTYDINGIKGYMQDLMWVENGQLNTLTTASFMFDECDDILEHFRTTDN